MRVFWVSRWILRSASFGFFSDLLSAVCMLIFDWALFGSPQIPASMGSEGF
jgi:hypothetical protein